MNGVRRLAIAFDSTDARDALFSNLGGFGAEIDCFDCGAALRDHCLMHEPDLVILALGGGENSPANEWPSLGERPLSAVVEGESGLRQALRIGDVVGLVIGPLSANLLQTMIDIALRQLDRMQDLQSKLSKAHQMLLDRKVIERAKGVLMQQARIDEAEAFARMRRTARSSRVPIAEIARAILAAGGLNEEDGPDR